VWKHQKPYWSCENFFLQMVWSRVVRIAWISLLVFFNLVACVTSCACRRNQPDNWKLCYFSPSAHGPPSLLSLEPSWID
jgi:hypothetical protein